MKRTLIYIGAACAAFTFSSLLYYVFRLLGLFPPLTESMSITLFLVSAIITCLIWLTHQLPVEHPAAVFVLEILCVVAVLTAGGLFFEMFPFNIWIWSSVVLSGLLAYLSVFVLIYLTTKADERRINDILMQRRTARITLSS
ncbi:hypothetical protein [Sporosarcina trichiuri]|uniref:hypothetical protein n=1 Tax=Sporosarcina trichiuri TaxID=3056445 RepID=UPI0025B2FAEB|nr:hypothetical protein [Sporosarcina sp. 0.2-SM1T-5]WJY26096.1 hypothetical protein QWT68_08340 [Sporosarcina sp. 0.2-SM1T-5]